jgi:hypothetical protein
VTPPAPAQGQTAPDAAPAEGAPVDPAAALGTAAPGPAGQLATVPVNINVVGDYFEVQGFVSKLETLSRALRITTLNLAPGASPTAGEGGSTNVEDGRSLTTTISGFVYMAANRPATTAVSVPGDAAPPADATVDPAATTPRRRVRSRR